VATSIDALAVGLSLALAQRRHTFSQRDYRHSRAAMTALGMVFGLQLGRALPKDGICRRFDSNPHRDHIVVGHLG